jgi:opacity protein-like surface antigen
MRILVLLATLCTALCAALPAAAQSSRTNTWEVYIGPVFTDGKTYTFEGGTDVRTDTGVGLNIGFAKNLNAHWSVGMDLTWSDQDYRANVQPGIGNANRETEIRSAIESYGVRFFGTYHFLSGPFTPLVTGGLGWTYIDTNIPSGLPESFCWYYPWYGSYCGTAQPTYGTTKFSYNAGLGVRYDFGKGVARFILNSQWVDFGGSYGGSANALQYRLDIGTKF